MSIKLRLALLLGLLLVGFAGALVALGVLERRERAEMFERERQTRTLLLTHAIDAMSRSLPQFATDTAQSEEFGRLVVRSDAAPAQLQAYLAGAGLSSAWIVTSDGRAGPRIAASKQDGDVPFPLAPPDFTALVAETPSPRFFAELADGLHEVCVRRITYGPPGHWLLVTRRWNDEYLQGLEQAAESRLTLRGPQEISATPVPGAIVLLRPLADWRGHPVRVLRVEQQLAEVEEGVDANDRLIRVFFSFGLMVIAATWLMLQGWVLRPLTRIGESLSRNAPELVMELSAEKSEFGRVAGLVRSSFEQRQALEREVRERAAAQAALERSEAALQANLEERSRLGRDLHDGVIQSLYAAGMGLSGVRALLQPEQTEAALRLEQSRAALNETIHDVRNFLIGLEPEALKLHTFGEAVASLLDMMHGIRPFRSRVEIDEDLAGRLTLAHRVHALQITREAVSNALRHGAATTISVTLRRLEGRIEFEVTDDGRGFDATASSPGKGLANFSERARELGASLSVESQPGRGTRVRLNFNQPSL
jgi:signal transduction histidine kinase